VKEPEQERTMTLRDYWRVVWLHRGLIAVIVVLVTGGAYARAATQPDVYVATARLMYAPPANVANAVAGYSADLGQVSYEVQSVVSLVSSPAVAERAASFMPAEDAVGYSVEAVVAVPANASSTSVADVVDITAQASSGAAAAAVANAYAKAVIELRKEREQESWRAAQRIVERQLALYQTPQSKLTGDYAVLSQQLRNLQIAEASANGNFLVIVPATAPGSPASPKPVKSAVFGFIVSLFFGVALAFVINQFDTRVRSYREISDILGLPVVGRVPFIKRRSDEQGILVAVTDPEGSVSESLRVLRRNLEWSGIDERLKSLVITSLGKSEGKTATVCNLAVTLARGGSKVLLIDADLRHPQVHRAFGIPNVAGLTSVVLGKASLEHAMREYDLAQYPGRTIRTVNGALTSQSGNAAQLGRLMILTSGPQPPNPGEVAASKSCAALLATLRESGFDYVLVDTPPMLLFGDAGSLAPAVDGVLVAVSIDKARRPLLDEGREQLEALPGRKIGLVVVGERLDRTQYSSYATYATAKVTGTGL
jgi:Mrp family chromosome partitioning ATPase/capsular polysaccharide biosynthesis protein